MMEVIRNLLLNVNLWSDFRVEFGGEVQDTN